MATASEWRYCVVVGNPTMESGGRNRVFGWFPGMREGLHISDACFVHFHWSSGLD